MYVLGGVGGIKTRCSYVAVSTCYNPGEATAQQSVAWILLFLQVFTYYSNLAIVVVLFQTQPGISSCRPRPASNFRLALLLLLLLLVWLCAGRPALELLKEGLRDLRDLCNILEDRVEQEIPP